MATETDADVLSRIWSEGKRMLALQYEARETARSGAVDLLKLAVAAMGGTIVVAGILTTARTAVDGLALSGLAAGIGLLVTAAIALSRISAGFGGVPEFHYGPDFRRVVDRMREAALTSAQWHASLIESLSDWQEQNTAAIDGIQAAKSAALSRLIFGVISILAALLYIVGGAILG